MQDEIVNQIGGALDGTWTGALVRAVQAGAKGQPTHSLDAYELYLLGAEAKHQFTPEAAVDAVRYLRRALEIDPELVPAMVTLSIVVGYQADWTSDEVEAAALIDEAVRLSEKSAEIDPNHPDALLRLACMRVCAQARRADGFTFAARAVEIAPTNPDVLAVVAWCYPFADQDQSPLDWVRQATAINPGHPAWYDAPLAMAALYAGDIDLALRAGLAAPPLPEVLMHLGAAEALSGDVTNARATFDRFATETLYRSISAYFLQGDERARNFRPLRDGNALPKHQRVLPAG